MKRMFWHLSAFTIVALWGTAPVFAAGRISAGGSVELITPNGGEGIEGSSAVPIIWNSADVLEPATVEILLSSDGGGSWTTLASGLPNSGSYSWGVPYAPTGQGLVRVVVTAADLFSVSDDSDSLFQIVDTTPPTVMVLRPTGGETWDVGTLEQVRWKAADASQTLAINIAYSTDDGATWSVVDHSPSNSGSYDWSLPDAPSPHALIRVTASDPASNVNQATSAVFVIRGAAAESHTIAATAGPGGTITPAGDVTVARGADQAFVIAAEPHFQIAGLLVDGVSAGAADSYTFAAVTAAHTIEASFAADSHSLAVSVVGEGGITHAPDQASHPHGTAVELTATAAPGYAFTGWSGDATGSDVPLVLTLDADRSVTATFTESEAPLASVIFPNGGERIWIGNRTTLLWNATDNVAVTGVDLLLSRNGAAGPFELIAADLPNTGSFDWIPTGSGTADALLEVVARDAAGNSGADRSDAALAFQAPEIRKLVSFRADSADGSSLGGTAWTDLAGDHDGAMWNFTFTPNSGWRGDGTAGNPHRLEFAGEEPAAKTRVVIPGGSVPELQSIGALTAAVWFKTGFDGPRPEYDYILEWVQRPTPDLDPEYEGRGMSIVIQNGSLQVYSNPWIDVMPVTPNTWYHVAVVKDTNDLRIYVNGERLHTGTKSHRGIQESDLTLGCSVFRQFEDAPLPYADFFTGAIAQMCLTEGPMSDVMVRDLYEADRARYHPAGQTGASPVPVTSLVTLRAAAANGVAAYPVLGAASYWADLDAPHTGGQLYGFGGTPASGWQGDGTPDDPFRLQFDGLDDCVVIPAGSITELQNIDAVTAEIWIKPDATILGPDYRYVMEWLAAHGSVSGLSLAIQNGKLQLYLSNPGWTEIAPIEPERWHHIVVVKAPGTVRVHVNGAQVYEGAWVNTGDQTTELTLGSSIWRGPGQFGEHFSGSMMLFRLWRGVLSPPQIRDSYVAELGRLRDPGDLINAGDELRRVAPRTNPVRYSLEVQLRLPSAEPARLELIDVAGRQVRRLEVGAKGAGTHWVNLGRTDGLNAGVYFLRLTQGPRVSTTKATIVR